MYEACRSHIDWIPTMTMILSTNSMTALRMLNSTNVLRQTSLTCFWSKSNLRCPRRSSWCFENSFNCQALRQQEILNRHLREESMCSAYLRSKMAKLTAGLSVAIQVRHIVSRSREFLYGKSLLHAAIIPVSSCTLRVKHIQATAYSFLFDWLCSRQATQTTIRTNCK